MKSAKTWMIVIFIIINVCIISVFFLNRIKSLIEKVEFERDNIQFENSYLKKEYAEFGNNFQTPLDFNLNFWDVKGDTISLNTMINKEREYLVFCFRYKNCSDCVEHCLSELYKIQNSENYICEVLIWPFFDSYRELFVFKNQYDNFSMYAPIVLKSDSIVSKIDKPLFFFISKGVACKYYTVPIINKVEITEMYLNSIIKEVNTQKTL